MAQGRKFAVFDIDGTLIRWQLYHALTDELARRGHIQPASYKAMRQARTEWKQRKGSSFRDYEGQVIDVYEAILKTLTHSQLEEAVQAVFDEYKDQVYTYTRDLIRQLKQEGYILLAISGSQTEIVAKIAAYYGFDDYTGTDYGRSKTGFDGTKATGVHHKDKTLKQLVKKHGLDFKGSLAIGDSYGDAAMLKLVEEPIAFNPEDSLFDIAQAEGWPIIIERKNVIIKLEKVHGRYQLAETNQR